MKEHTKSTNIYGFPKQKISNKKKDKDFHIESLEALVRESSFNSTDKAHLKSLYDAANNELNDSAYKYVTNPYNSEFFKKINFPAKVRNYPIISPVLNLLTGEKSKRPKNYQVVATNADSVTEAQKEQFGIALQLYQATFINELNKLQDTGIPEQDIQQPKQVLEEMSANPADKRAIVGQEALDYLLYDLELIHQFQKLFYDYIVAGYCFSYKGVACGNVIYEDVSPLEIDVRKAPGVEYVEDGEAVIRRKLMSTAAVVDRFYDVLTPEDVDALENPSQHREVGGFSPFYDVDNRENLDTRLIEVIHGVWKSFKKIGILTYNDNGVFRQMEVDEDYDPLPEEDIQWMWVSETRECYRIDNRIYTEFGPIKAQRSELDNISVNKLPYNGIEFSGRHSKNKSLVDIGMAFQVMYNIFHYRFELTMAKNKDKIILMPIDAIPRDEGWDEYKFMYFADAMGFAFIKPNGEGTKGFNQYNVLDAGLSDYAKVMIDIMNNIKTEWEEAVGITRQRKGEVAASDSVGGTQEAVFRSSVITEEMFRKFEKFEEKELQGLIDYSKIAWVGGKKAMYINSDMRTAMLNVDPVDYMETQFAVFVRNSGKETEKFDLIKQYALPALQNGLKLSAMADILEANNFSKVKDFIRKAEESQQQIDQQMEQQQQQLEAQRMQLDMQLKQAEIQEGDKQRAFDGIQKQLDRENKIDIELLRAAHGKEANTDIDADGIPDAAEIIGLRNEQLGLALDDKHKTRELDQKDRELDLKDKDIDQKLTVEKLKAKTALKNKVSGESKAKKK